MNLKDAEKIIGTRWMLKDQSNVSVSPEPGKYPYNGYTVLMITNTSHTHDRHPAQVIYQGDNGYKWSLELSKWPGNLIPETNVNYPLCGKCRSQMITTPHDIFIYYECECCGKIIKVIK